MFQENLFKKIKKIIIKKYLHIIRVKPCYEIVNKLNETSVMVDIGTGDNADFSQALIRKFNLISFGFDPTRKHQPALKALEARSNGHFKIFDYALCAQAGAKLFYESLENISGSLINGHTNVLRDTIDKYAVNTVTLANIFEIIKKDRIDLLKMDVEGEEYSIINSTDKAVFDKISQMIIEFHHHCIAGKSPADTAECIKNLEKIGFITHAIDSVNYLFFKK